MQALGCVGSLTVRQLAAEFIEEFARVKRIEATEASLQVSPAEFRRYVDFY